MIIDTHDAVEKLLAAGNSKENAEAIVRLINSQDANLATKGDILRLESQVQLLEAKFDKDMIEIKTELKWMRILMLSVLGLLIKIAFFN